MLFNIQYTTLSLLVVLLLAMPCHNGTGNRRGGGFGLVHARRKWDKVAPEVSLFYPGAHYIMLTFHDYDDCLLTSEAGKGQSKDPQGEHAQETYTQHMTRILDILKARNARATFFVQGANAQKFPEIVKRMSKERHEVANLGWKTEFSPAAEAAAEAAAGAAATGVTKDGTPKDEELLTQIKNAADAIEEATGKPPAVFRPPIVRSGKQQQQQQQGQVATTLYDAKHAELVRSTTAHQVVLWSKDDTDTCSSAGTAAQVEASTKSISGGQKGDVLLLHVSPATANALDTALESLQSDGFETITLTEMMSFPDDKPHRR